MESQVYKWVGYSNFMELEQRYTDAKRLTASITDLYILMCRDLDAFTETVKNHKCDNICIGDTVRMLSLYYGPVDWDLPGLDADLKAMLVSANRNQRSCKGSLDAMALLFISGNDVIS